MLRRQSCIFAVIILSLASTAVTSAQNETDTIISSQRKGLVGRIIDYFDKTNKRVLTKKPNFAPLGGPYFSSEKGLGIGLMLAGDYSTCPSDSLLPPSNISIKGNIATKGYYSIGIDGIHIYPNNTRRINYELDFQSFQTYFWGIGYDWASNNGNKTKYHLLDVILSADYGWSLSHGLYIGPALEFGYTKAYKMENHIPWQDEPLDYFSSAVGGKLQYDLRDNMTYPHKGLLIEFIQLFSPRFLGNSSHSFISTEISCNFYIPIWKGGILASRFHNKWTFGCTPWGKLPFLGDESMRAYYEGRYRDKCATDITVELRQHVYRRIGIALWTGAGTVYRKPSDISIKRLLPEIGTGLRWEFKKNTNVRLDIGFGKHSRGLMFGLNEAF